MMHKMCEKLMKLALVNNNTKKKRVSEAKTHKGSTTQNIYRKSKAISHTHSRRQINTTLYYKNIITPQYSSNRTPESHSSSRASAHNIYVYSNGVVMLEYLYISVFEFGIVVVVVGWYKIAVANNLGNAKCLSRALHTTHTHTELC